MLANAYAQTIASFEESNRMYAIPAETAAQGEPFQKENLPGPGKWSISSRTSLGMLQRLAAARLSVIWIYQATAV